MGYDRLNTRVYSLGMERCKLAAFLLFSFFWVQKIARRNGITNSRVEKKKKKRRQKEMIGIRLITREGSKVKIFLDESKLGGSSNSVTLFLAPFPRRH